MRAREVEMSEQEQQIVWEATLDDRYRCVVSRTGARTGRLTITDTETEEELHAEEVGLAYGALFGPDVGDIQKWQEMAIKMVVSAAVVNVTIVAAENVTVRSLS